MIRLLLCLIAILPAAVAAQTFDAPEFRVIPAPQDIPRIGAVRISCFEGPQEVVRFLQLEPEFGPLPDGRLAFSWTRPPEEWTDGVYTCSASVGKDEDSVPIPSAPVEVIIDIPLSPPVLEVGGGGSSGEPVIAAMCVSPEAIDPAPHTFTWQGLTCWDRSQPTGPYTEQPITAQIPGATLAWREPTAPQGEVVGYTVFGARDGAFHMEPLVDFGVTTRAAVPLEPGAWELAVVARFAGGGYSHFSNPGRVTLPNS
jgi:hypothetical protein